jgi:hypothetical protein
MVCAFAMNLLKIYEGESGAISWTGLADFGTFPYTEYVTSILE